MRCPAPRKYKMAWEMVRTTLHLLLLLEMAKLIGRTGLPQGFFLENDSPFPDGSGVDLRTLLLYQAGLIKMPIRLGPAQGNPANRSIADIVRSAHSRTY